MNHKVNTYIFDFDWVIIDTAKKFAEIFFEVATRMWKKVTWEEAQYYSQNRHTSYEFFITPEERKIANRLYQEIEEEKFPASKTPLITGAKEKIEEILNQNKNVAIFTDRSRKSLDETLLAHQINHLFDHTITMCCTWEKKPSPTWLIHILQRFWTPVENCLYTWDTHVDLKAAQALEMPFVWVLSWVNKQKDWWEHFHIPDITHLKVKS